MDESLEEHKSQNTHAVEMLEREGWGFNTLLKAMHQNNHKELKTEPWNESGK